ncbi:MAG: type IX secretion system sortase PorU [Bacteroidales bacterium]|nr:type IX secretion system sortase PorU [Bacteroidales bacterium]
MIKKPYILILLLTLAFGVNAQTMRYAQHSRLATGKWVKIRVAEEGVYQLNASTLKGMGFNDPKKVSLYGYNLPILPEAEIENLDDDLTEIPLYRKSDGTLLFYSCGPIQWSRESENDLFTHLNNPYSRHIYYFLTENTGTPAILSKQDAASTSNDTQKTFMAHELHEEDAYSFLNSGRTFFESYDFANGAKTYQLTLNSTCAGDISFELQYGAAGSSTSTLNISVNDNILGHINFDKVANENNARVNKGVVKLYDQTGTTFKLRLSQSTTPNRSGHLDYIRMTYEAQLSLSGKNFLVFNPMSNSTKPFELQGASSSTIIWDVSNPTAPQELTGTLSGTAYKFAAPHANFAKKYVALNTSANFPTPQSMGVVAHQDLHSLDNINLLIIVPASGKLTEQAERLAAAHVALDSIKCAVVRADQVYNEFSAGTPDITAYRRLMKMLYDKQYTTSPLTGTQKGGLNILLFGNSYWDNRLLTQGMTSKSQDDYLLAYESEDSWSHTRSYVLEEYVTLLADGKGVSPLKEKPDCGVGRLPVTTANEAKTLVDKLINYMSNREAGAWKNTICLMGDDDKTNIHMEDAENVLKNTEKLFPDYYYKRIYWDSYNIQRTATGNRYPDIEADIDKTMQEGALIMNYTGHAAPYTLSNEQVLITKDFQEWTSPRSPIWVTAACDVAPFDMNTENIGCEALLNKQGAAVAFIGTARTVYSSPNRVLNRYFMSHVLAMKNNGEPFTLGEALAQAKADILESKRTLTETEQINKVHFVLLGDPAMRIITPTHQVKIDKLNGKEIDSQNPPTISAGETITIEGHITNAKGEKDNGFNGTVSSTVFDSEEEIAGKLNAGEDIKAFKYKDRTRTLYAGSDSIKAGTFTFTFPVPLDINYSDLAGLMKLYAINQDKTIEAHGTFDAFLVGGSAIEEKTDTVGPTIATFADGHNVSDISYVTATPTLRIELQDDSGINTTGNGLGHDIVAIIDNNEATTYTLNGYYTQSVGDYRSGTVHYTLPALPAGKHTLVIRAFDTLNNMGQQAYAFEVVEGLVQMYDIFDFTGRLISSSTEKNPILPKGIYIRRTRITSPKGDISTSAEKFIVTQ